MMDQQPICYTDSPVSRSTHRRSNQSTRLNHDGKNPTAGAVDIVALVRSLQRTAGLEDCFRNGKTECLSLDCAWRKHCLGISPTWETFRSVSETE